MKKILYSLLILSLFTACQKETPTYRTCGSEDTYVEFRRANSNAPMSENPSYRITETCLQRITYQLCAGFCDPIPPEQQSDQDQQRALTLLEDFPQQLLQEPKEIGTIDPNDYYSVRYYDKASNTDRYWFIEANIDQVPTYLRTYMEGLQANLDVLE